MFLFNLPQRLVNFCADSGIYLSTFGEKINRMKKIFAFSLIVLCFSVLSVFAQTSRIVKKDLSQAEIDRIIKTFSQNEQDFRDALTNYVFNRKATIQTIGMGGQITGTYHRESFMTFASNGSRFEKITYFPVSTLKDINVTPEDLEDLGGVNPFALEPSVTHQYNFTYLGKEKIDELDLYVFDVAPKQIPNPKKTKQRMFVGRIWVDDRDLMIVKSKGKAVPETKDNKFPIVETWRENIDGKYWFPALSSSDDELVFDEGYSVKLKIRVRYEDYKQGRTDVIILDEEEVVEDKPAAKPAAKPTPTPTPSPTPKKP